MRRLKRFETEPECVTGVRKAIMIEVSGIINLEPRFFHAFFSHFADDIDGVLFLEGESVAKFVDFFEEFKVFLVFGFF